MLVNRRDFLAASAASLLAGHGTAQGNGNTLKVAENPPEDRLGWFREAKFGMFVHWGVYSVLGGEWRGKQLPVPPGGAVGHFLDSNVENIMTGLRIPLADYGKVARRLNPVNFDARRWVSMIKATGMKYLVITAKHQDGFAMFHSKVSKYNIVDWTPFKRDPLKELSEVCRQEGIRFCVYYSHRNDNADPNAYSNTWDFHAYRRDFEKYYKGKAMAQVRELLRGYGPLGLIWFDSGIYTRRQAKEMVDLVHGLQPRCLVNGRVGNYGLPLMGDYQSLGDHELPSGELQQYFEAIQTLNHCWGYSKFDDDWKPPREVIRQLVNVVSRGGNYLLDVGATGEGTFPPAAVDILAKVGEWVRLNGESIYGTSASPFGELPWGRCTVKGEKLYLHVFEWPPEGELSLEGLKNEVKRAYLLQDSSRSLEFRRNGDRVSVRLPGRPVDKDDTVVVLEIGDKPEVRPPVVVQKGRSTIKLDYVTAVTAGKARKQFNRVGRYYISGWDDPQDSITWGMRNEQPGRYQVWIIYSVPKEWEGGKYQVSVGKVTLEAKVVDTRAYCYDMGGPCEAWYHYLGCNIGTVDLSEAREYKLTIRPASALNHNLMYFNSIELRPELTPVL